MPRTTFDIDLLLLKEIKDLQKKEGRSMGKIVSQLLAEALTRRKSSVEPQNFQWISQPMRALVDLVDKDALHAILDMEKT